MLQTSDARSLRQDVLRDISRALLRPLDEIGVLRAMYAELARALDVTICFFGRFDAVSQTVEVVWQMHDGSELPGGQFPLGNGPTSEAIRTCRPQLIRNWSADGPPVQLQYATDRPSLPQSSVVVPVVYGGQVAGVLSLQSYADCAYDEADVCALEAVADLLALALFPRSSSTGLQLTDAEAILASMDDALLVLDTAGRVVRLNRAARRLFSQKAGGLILGHRVDTPQADGAWPLGSAQLSERLRPVVEHLQDAETPTEDVELPFDDGPLRCRVSPLRKGTTAAGAIMVLRKSS